MVSTIYLDTHHISRAAAGRNRISRFLGHANLQFVYSATHVVESLPTEPQENSAAVQRLEIITRPEARSVVGWGRLAQIESSGDERNFQRLLCDRDEMLFPDFSIKRTDWNKKIRTQLKQALEIQISDQNLRRSFQAKLLKQGKLTPAAFHFLRESAKENAQAFSSEMRKDLRNSICKEIHRHVSKSYLARVIIKKS